MEKNNINSKKKLNKKSLFFGLGIILLVGLIGTYRSCTVNNEGVYTIATVYNFKIVRGGIGFDFKYIFRGVEYRAYAVGSVNNTSMKDEGKRFFIQVLANDPERCLITSIQVPDSIIEAPSEGWKELPN